MTICTDVASGVFGDLLCSSGYRTYSSYRGRVAWHPLTYRTPILVEIEARQIAGTRFPLFVEILPVRDHPPELGYCDGPGYLIMSVYGSTVCDAWETVGPLDLSPWVAPGDEYVLRLHFFGDPRSRYQSPFVDCVRVRRATTAVEPGTWGFVKSIYR